MDPDGLTTHVLNYPNYDLKEKFRIIYYDGEAALALLRLYQINQDKRLLETVKLMFENFIHKRYEKYHDHWLSYCTNELTKICPEEKYFIFGLNNYLKHFIFIRNRKTTYVLKSNDIQISMDGKGRWVDNVMVERLWRSVKYEEVYLKAYSNVLDAKKQLNAYFEFYNLKRPHSSLDKMTPDEFYYDQLPQQNKVA